MNRDTRAGWIGRTLYTGQIAALEAENAELKRKLERIAAVVDGTAYIDDREPEDQLGLIYGILKGGAE